jgi:hypothetical protein
VRTKAYAEEIREKEISVRTQSEILVLMFCGASGSGDLLRSLSSRGILTR